MIQVACESKAVWKSGVVLASVLLACAAAQPAEPPSTLHPPTPPASPPPASPPQFVRRVFADPIQGNRHYVVYLPKGFSRDRHWPVIMMLNGLGENGEDGIRQISNNFGVDVWRMREVFPFVVVAPQCRRDGRWTDPHGEGKLAMDVLADVERAYGTDPDRVYLTGISSGGAGVFSVASHHPERFAAIVPLCGNGGGDPQALAGANLPMWNFYNDGDSPELVAFNRKRREQLIRLGRSPLVTEYHDSGHVCWKRAYATEGLYSWLLTQSRRKNQEEKATFTLVEPQEIAATWRRIGGAECAVQEGQILALSGAGGGAVVLPASMTDCELHVDARWPMEESLRIGLFPAGDSGDSSSAAFVLTIPYADTGLGGAAFSTTNFGDSAQNPEFAIRTVKSLDPVGQRQLDPRGWNDLRIVRRGEALTLSINGWPALECCDARLTRAYRFGLLAPGASGAGACWRYVRWRKLKTASNAGQGDGAAEPGDGVLKNGPGGSSEHEFSEERRLAKSVEPHFRRPGSGQQRDPALPPRQGLRIDSGTDLA